MTLMEEEFWGMEGELEMDIYLAGLPEEIDDDEDIVEEDLEKLERCIIGFAVLASLIFDKDDERAEVEM